MVLDVEPDCLNLKFNDHDTGSHNQGGLLNVAKGREDKFVDAGLK